MDCEKRGANEVITFLTTQQNVMDAGKVRRTQLEKFTQVRHIYSGLGLQWNNATSKPMQRME